VAFPPAAMPSEPPGQPGLVRRYLERALPHGAEPVRQVRVEQTGRMFRGAGSRPMRFTAVEHFAVDRVAFSWEARFPIIAIAPRISLRVTDGYTDGRGALIVRALGVPVQVQRGREVTVGEAYRYLAELPWAPHAMLANAELDWREVDTSTVEVATAAGGERATVRFEFDSRGDIIRCRAPSRPRADHPTVRGMPWGGEFRDYRTIDGVRLPARAEVYWEEPEGRFVYWEGEILAVRGLGEDFTAPRGIA